MACKYRQRSENPALASRSSSFAAALLLALAGLSLTTRVAAAPDVRQARERQLRESLLAAVESFRAQTSTPAVAVGVVADGKIVLRTALGVQHLGQRTPASARTLFHMASVSKPVVATAIMQLAQSGTLGIEDLAWRHVPAFAPADHRWREVTIAQLLSHTSGLPDVEDYEWQRPQVDANALDRYLREWRTSRLVAQPGTAFSYSNLGYEVLAGVIQHATGETFEHYMTVNVLRPLGMDDSTFYLPDADPALIAWPHRTGADGRVVPLEFFPYNRPHAASSTLYSNVDDMLRFMQLHLSGNGSIALRLSSQSLTRQHTADRFTFQHTIPIDRHPAFGWFEMKWKGRHLLVHEGQDDGFTSMLLLEPATQAGLVLMANKRDDASSSELWTLTLKLLEQLPKVPGGSPR